MSDAPSKLHEHEFDAFIRGHTALEHGFTRVLAAVEAGDHVAIQRLWRDAQPQLLAHLEAEERFVLPAFGTIDPREALQLLRDHAKIRMVLLELGIAVELNCARVERVQHFVDMLRAHAVREDLMLYRWCSQQNADAQSRKPRVALL